MAATATTGDVQTTRTTIHDAVQTVHDDDDDSGRVQTAAAGGLTADDIV